MKIWPNTGIQRSNRTIFIRMGSQYYIFLIIGIVLFKRQKRKRIKYLTLFLVLITYLCFPKNYYLNIFQKTLKFHQSVSIKVRQAEILPNKPNFFVNGDIWGVSE